MNIDSEASAVRSLTVAVLTYKRNDDLKELLPQLVDQAAHVGSAELVTRVVVIDNDPDSGARTLVRGYGPAPVPVIYEAESVPGIAAARNRALTVSADQDLLVFIDDDERPRVDWLAGLIGTWHREDCPAAVIGPVVSRFSVQPEAWIVAGDFFRRRRLDTGARLEVGATNNLLLDLRQVRALGLSFDLGSGISGGSDTLFTKQIVAAGRRMVWCDEAVVEDVVPPERLTRRWVLQRALRSGNSWSLTTVRTAHGPVNRLRTRLSLTVDGAVRLAGGAARNVLGIVLRSQTHQAKGLRTAARGAGMAMGAWGLTYREYRRKKA